MAGILGYVSPAFFEYPQQSQNPMVAKDFNKYTVPPHARLMYEMYDEGADSLTLPPRREVVMPHTPISVVDCPSFFDDYYQRIHLTPQYINLQTIASQQTRYAYVWNAYTEKNAVLEDIQVNNPSGITITGEALPFSMKPLKELTYDISIGVSGPPAIDLEILFNFSNAEDPPPLVIVGTRAIKFELVPEVPVRERWEWLSDVQVATDGTEQRAAVRGEVPFEELSFKVVFTTKDAARKFYTDFITSGGRLWIPEFQYATDTTQASSIGSYQLYFDRARTDVRAGEYLLVNTGTTHVLLEVDVLNADGCLITSPLLVDVPKGAICAPGASALVDETSLARYSVDDVAETYLSCRMLRQRETVARPGSTATISTFKSTPVLERLPIADELVKDDFSFGNVALQNSTSLPDLISRWDYARVGGKRVFKVNRHTLGEMDYWKAFFGMTKGRVSRFFMSTYREDLELAFPPSTNASSYTVKGTDYADKIYAQLPTHRYIQIETAAGIHRTYVTLATSYEGNSVLGFETEVPAGAGWLDVKKISLLIPFRLGDDVVEWEHRGLESYLSFTIRTAEM